MKPVEEKQPVDMVIPESDLEAVIPMFYQLRQEVQERVLFGKSKITLLFTHDTNLASNGLYDLRSDGCGNIALSRTGGEV